MSALGEKRRVVEVFIKYARLGLASGNLDRLSVYECIKGCSRNSKEACELLAVYDTVRFLKLMGKKDLLKAIYAVYFSLPLRPHKGEIGGRVLRHAYDSGCDERTIYRRLSFVLRLYQRILSEDV
jgi:hypothetical protein